MKRFWLLALLMAGSLAVPTVPAFAKAKKAAVAEDESGSADASETTIEDVNSAMGSLASRVGEIEKTLAVKFSGDVRLRWAFIAQQNSQAGVTIGDSSRGRYRARFGVSKTVGDFTGKFRIATGSTASPWSQNNTFDTALSNPSVLIDTASLTWTPSFANGMLSITAGKMANPLTKTGITWDSDIQPEGVAIEWKKGDFTLRGTYFELQNLYASGTANGNMDLFMNNAQLEYLAKFDSTSSLGLMAGYEYIPNSTLMMSSGVTTVLGKNPITGFGGVLDPGGVGRDWNVAEGMITVKHNINDLPLKWYLHVTDNLNGKNLPTNSTASGTYTNFTNQYAWLFGLDIGAMANPGDCTGTFYVASLDPNGQLPFLTDDDPGETNRQYAFGSFSCMVDTGVSLKLSEWLVNREYYAIVTGPSSLGGSSQNPEWVSYLDCILAL